jgi:endonuclease/exonuclease/phosphatase family metal-dependent hydrolase
MIKIMSFNIRYGTADDGYHSWQFRKELVVERIQAFHPDLLGIQECRNDFQAAYLKARLKDYYFIGIERGGKNNLDLEMTPLLIQRSAFEVSESGCFWLSMTPDVPGSTDWGSELPRIVTWAKLQSRQESDTQIYFLNTHFDYASHLAQSESAKLLRNHMDALGPHMPVILCGDFNTEKDSIPYLTLLATSPTNPGGLHDTYRDVHPTRWKNAGTLHGFGQLKNLPTIDWILASEHFVTIEAAIDKSRNGEQYPSDHFPLLAKVKLD